LQTLHSPFLNYCVDFRQFFTESPLFSSDEQVSFRIFDIVSHFGTAALFWSDWHHRNGKNWRFLPFIYFTGHLEETMFPGQVLYEATKLG